MAQAGDTITYTYNDNTNDDYDLIPQSEDVSNIDTITVDYIDGAGGESKDSSVSGGSGGRVENVVADVSAYNTIYIWVPTQGTGRYGGYTGGATSIPPIGEFYSGSGGGSAEISVSNTDRSESQTEPFIAGAGGGGGAGGSQDGDSGRDGARRTATEDDADRGIEPPLGGDGGPQNGDGFDGEGAVSGHGSGVPITDSGTTITGGGSGSNTDGEIQITYEVDLAPPDPPSNLNAEVQ